MILLDGKTLSQKIMTSLKEEVSNLNLNPILDIIIVGDDLASLKYVSMKQNQASLIGIGGTVHHLDKNSNTDDVLNLVSQLNNDKNITAFMVQLPLPSQIDTSKVLSLINPQKDADGLNPLNLGLLFQKDSQPIISATALGILKLLEEYNIDLSGKNAVIIGRSSEVAIPLSALFLSKNATTTICHSYTKNLKKICQQADILVSSIGKPQFFTSEYIKTDAIIIDVGFTTDSNNKVSGDFDFDQVASLASFITPVPGGVGPMTITSLLYNTIQIAKK
ncbi:MAG: bifunctional 5,10-methylenetetrahydrofolate dehydrogenase/5,10-methenyltetrahydrofolate cyclohydrolase [Candidatus Shapirobacteria bacterium]|jgi:methylenetetrahydrofolate dehydrogenase (NADP+)/methenyltetrahydrofolate cyclohydrolase